MIDRLLLAVATPRRTAAASIMRIGVALVVAGLYIQNIAFRSFLWGPHGIVPTQPYAVANGGGGLSLYYLSDGSGYFNAVFFTGLVVTLLYAAGVLPFLSGPLCFVFTWSLLARNGFVQDAGWNLVRILLVYLLLADTTRFALFPIRIAAVAKRLPPVLGRMRAMVHNSALVLILFQLCLLYATSCFYKITGHKWQDGTALYYVLRSNQFDISGAGTFVYESALLVALGTYGTLLFQAAYPFWIWQRPYKYAVAVGAVLFHVGIFITMALPFFSAVMIVAEAALFSDDEYRRAYSWLRARLPARLDPMQESLPARARSGG